MGRHALCWVHAERLVHKLDAFTDANRAAQQHVRKLDLELLCRSEGLPNQPRQQPPSLGRCARGSTASSGRRTGFTTLDRLLARLHANKAELLTGARPPLTTPLHTNGSRERHPLPGHTAEGQRRNTQRFRAGLPRHLPRASPRPAQKLGVAFWDYPRQPPQRCPGPGSHSTSAGIAHPLPWAARLETSTCPGFCPCYLSTASTDWMYSARYSGGRP